MNRAIDYDQERQFRTWWLNGTGGTAAQGLTVRDYFAAMALQGMLAEDAESYTFQSAAEGAYQMADAMMEARSRAEGKK